MADNIEPILNHTVNVDMLEKDRAFCQKTIINQYDESKIDEKRLAEKLKELRKASATAKENIAKMHELSDKL